ncbi:histidine phosphatase family protein [Paenibacillus arenilitoris]|uniref:Histidine phosphatase family protein n=1 Tax=Paenibacillus arenilitoris TaxID=2772299 RepID=A0A927H8Z8_9BACL|nr:histidine phosphatase family protein [Paenibacillus arenilitoris]MBD2872223.1 histidine phosphatase family protein [Paenibacillus arenilitoris]
MKTNIYLVRHAESPFEHGQERIRGLSEEGFAAARQVAERLKGVDVHYTASSPYARAKQTIQFLAEAKSLDIEEYEELVERPIKGLDYKAPWEELLAAIRISFDDKDYALEGGETTRQARNRAVPVIEKLLENYRGHNIVIGTHGNIMTIIMNHYDDRYGFDFWHQTSKPDIYKLAFDGNRLDHVERLWG